MDDDACPWQKMLRERRKTSSPQHPPIEEIESIEGDDDERKAYPEIEGDHVVLQELNIHQPSRGQFSNLHASAPEHRLGIVNPYYRMSSYRKCDGHTASSTTYFEYVLRRGAE